MILDLIKVLSPVLPFVTERMYLNMTSADKNENKDSIHLSDFPKCDNDKIDHELIEKVDSLKKVIESGRAVRKKANIKVRQPLQRLRVLLNNDEITSFIKDQEETILDELNIKEVIFSDEIKDFGTLTLKPNFKNMKMKFGDEMQDAIKSIGRLDASEVTKNVLNGSAIPENEYELTKDDLIIDLKANDGSESFLGNDLIVSLDTTISDSLRLEGVLRDLIRQIQLMRKEANFEIDDRIIISANFSDELKNIIDENKEYFMNEVLCKDIVANLKNSDYNSSFKYENNEIEIYLKKL